MPFAVEYSAAMKRDKTISLCYMKDEKVPNGDHFKNTELPLGSGRGPGDGDKGGHFYFSL